MSVVYIEHCFESDTSIEYTKNEFIREVEKISSVILTELELEKGDIVSIFLPTSVETYMIAFAIINAGGVVNNLFQSYGDDALLNRLAISQPKCLITNDNHHKRVKSLWPAGQVFSSNSLIKKSSDAEVIPFSLPYDNQLMFLHFTSGTTGFPKLVPHTRKDLQGVIETNKLVFQVDDSLNYLCTADIGWVTGVYYGMFLPLLTGVKSHVVKNMDGHSLLKALRQLKEWKIDVLYTSPTFLNMSLRYFKKHQPKLRTILSVGEKLPTALKSDYKEIGYDIIDTWWQTELGCVTIASTNSSAHMGVPLPFAELGFLQDNGDILTACQGEDSISGELLIRTTHPSIMEGYFNNPKANSSKFRDGFYLTGDLARLHLSGEVEYLSRADDVLVIAGELISPDEVESFVIDTFLEISSSVLVKNNSGKLVLYCVGEGDEREIQNAIADKLMSAMTPSQVIFVDNIPRTESGKIKRNLLKDA
ncbi:MAG: AMP-binding protein [Planctomycetes bacterium]|nr:AMP-binding protein [Planctomycetota bacterium]